MTGSLATTRRNLLIRMLASAATTALPLPATRVFAAVGSVTPISDGVLTLAIDDALRMSLLFKGRSISPSQAQDSILLAQGEEHPTFVVIERQARRADTETLHSIRAVSASGLELAKTIRFDAAYPGLALIETSLRNISNRTISVARWTLADHLLKRGMEGPAWSFAGASYADRRDWAQPVTPTFDQRNFMGMNASDYGGGTPVADVWNRNFGIAVGHLDTVPRLVSLPVAATGAGTRIALVDDRPFSLAPGESLPPLPTFVMVHEGDFFRPLDAYRRLMADRGLAAPTPPAASYDPIWCAWGYERDYTPEQVFATLPKARQLGLRWAVLDDGWQQTIGDWTPDRGKYPAGDADMRAFVRQIDRNGMRARLWVAPLAAKPSSQLLRDHPDWLLLGPDGKPQTISWWDALTLCPAHEPVAAHFRALVRKMIGEWGYAGLKLDGQHLNGVAPCHNPAHHHARPEESIEKLQDFWKQLYDEAVAANPQAVVEICPCGDSFAFHNLPATNNVPAADPLTSWQVRLKGKAMKALMGPRAAFAGDHVELSDGGRDFASSYGVGAIVSTKFTWPRDTDRPTATLPPGGYVLTPEKEAHWRRWIDLYQDNRLSQGDYRGGLYDLAFDRPEAHAIGKDGAMHYAFYAPRFDGEIELRGLGEGAYCVVDALTGNPVATVTAAANRVRVAFDGHLMLRTLPAGEDA
ncbi:alpha-galactosidase [Sphingobium amiense]|uniref:Alpha-galactosidase n=1 Tax=Sphingobium amiense TaxID=135719 RepID=A0A494VWG9_9SPHN|nr:glycoside hydrolase family 36 protein [Sphingobium amiense]BBD96754.1 alpha-galactosidase [Sphingobium amiense]